MKRCNHCLAYKYRSEFYKQTAAVDGLQPRCKTCCSRIGKTSYQKHHVKIQAHRATPAYREHLAAYGKVYYATNRERRRAQGKAYRQSHPELTPKRQTYLAVHHTERLAYLAGYRRQHGRRQRELERAWRVKNPERNRLKGVRRRSRMAGASGVCTLEQLLMRVAYYGHQCAYCRGPYETLDHVIPLARGGTNWPSNLRPCCRLCNTRKGTLLLHEWHDKPL